VNSQNNRFPMLIPLVPFPDVKVGVWFAVIVSVITGHFFFPLRLNLH
jgi:hypothetical protein